MLTKIRERATGWIAWVIVILITIPFALWGIQSYFENASEIPVATVNGEEIPVYTFQNELSRQRQAMARQLGSNFDPAFFESSMMRNRVVESMISNQLINQYVRDNRYSISDEHLKQRIETNPAFDTDGRFNADLYRDLLRSNGYTPQSYEAVERQSAAIDQLSAAVVDSAFVTPHELELMMSLDAQTRTADYALIPADRFVDEVVVPEQEIKDEYDTNAARYEAPARMKVEYVELSVDNLVSRIESSEDEIRDMYEQTKGRYKQAEARKASHILFAVKSSASEEDVEAVRSQAEAVLARAKDGEDFAALAAEFSEDPGSKDNGGDLGVVARGQMVQPFEDAVFAMAQNEIRGPIETRFGFHIIKLTELAEEKQRPFEDVRDEVAAEAARIHAENMFVEMSEQFENLVFEEPESLTAVADELDLEIVESDWFEESTGDGVAADARVRRAAFSEDVMTDDLNSAAIELEPDHLLALRKSVYEAAHPRPLEEVREEIELTLKQEKSREKVAAFGQELVASIADSSGWDEVTRNEQLDVQELPDKRNRVPGNLTELGNAVFSSSAPQPGQAIYDGIQLANGDFALYALHEVVQGDIDQIDEAQQDRLRQQLLARDGSGYYQKFQETMRLSADVVIDQQQLENPDALYQ